MKQITAEQLREKMQTNNTLMVINVLAEEYYKKCHIKGSVNIPYAQLKDSVEAHI